MKTNVNNIVNVVMHVTYSKILVFNKTNQEPLTTFVVILVFFILLNWNINHQTDWAAIETIVWNTEQF